MLRPLLLFLHVASAMGVVAALAVEALALTHLRRATGSSGARAALADLGVARRVEGPSLLLLLVTGFWLATAFWHWQGPWIRAGFLGLVVIGAIGGVMTGRVLRRLARRSEEQTLVAESHDVRHVLLRSFAIRALLLAAVVFLMTVKPT